LRVSDFHFDLPEELIAQHPPAERGSSRMLVLDRRSGALADEVFQSLPRLLAPGDLLILNDSRVLPARLFATRGGLATQANSPQPSGTIEVLLIEQVEDADSGENLWRALVKPARKVRRGETLHFYGAGGDRAVLTAKVVATGEFGERTLRFVAVEDFYERVGRIGHMPLPPYIRRDQAVQPDTAEDRERYQTVYSRGVGSAAAPTAGLHFTPEILAALIARGVEIRYLTLHVGLGTFQPVRVERLEEIRLHTERYTLPAATAEALNRAVAEGRRIVAVGTTTARTLEHVAGLAGERVGYRVEGREEHVPGAKAQVDDAAGMPGLKSQPILSKTGLAGLASRPNSNKIEAAVISGEIEAHSGSTSIFLSPGHRFRMVGGLLTNFHLPESTLLMLVSAFAAPEGEGDLGRRTMLAAYAHAIREGYRFYSFGDCMLLL
jgi:S-adenosylmethionine:tRNA ribosyltransferase-isomerase